MKCKVFLWPVLVITIGLSIAIEAHADPGNYPQYAQQNLPPTVKPEFIKVSALVDEIIGRKRPLIIDVRSQEEYQQSHIKGSVSIPLDTFADRLDEIPKDRPVVLY